MKKRVITLLCVAFWLIVWQMGAMALNQSILLVTPVDVTVKLAELVLTAAFGKVFFFRRKGYFSALSWDCLQGQGWQRWQENFPL